MHPRADPTVRKPICMRESESDKHGDWLTSGHACTPLTSSLSYHPIGVPGLGPGLWTWPARLSEWVLCKVFRRSQSREKGQEAMWCSQHATARPPHRTWQPLYWQGHWQGHWQMRWFSARRGATAPPWNVLYGRNLALDGVVKYWSCLSRRPLPIRPAVWRYWSLCETCLFWLELSWHGIIIDRLLFSFITHTVVIIIHPPLRLGPLRFGKHTWP